MVLVRAKVAGVMRGGKLVHCRSSLRVRELDLEELLNVGRAG